MYDAPAPAQMSPVTGQRPFAIAAVMVLCLLALPAASHPLSVSYSRFVVKQDAVAAVYRLPMDDMDLLLQLDTNLDGSVTAAELQKSRDAIAGYLRDHAEVEAGGRRLTPELRHTTTWRDNNDFPYLQAAVSYAAGAPVSGLRIRVHVLTDLYADHRNLADIDLGDHREEFVFQHGNTWSGQRGAADPWRTAREFTRLGIEHIFTGYDHVLFLLGLLLAGRNVRNLIAIVTSFTIAHSLTLALATLGLVQPVGWMIEALIALSIAYVGLENLVVQEIRHRWRITFFFGLVHGFGFASILQSMNLERGGLMISLFTFNLGVEIGQIAIVALFWPLLQRIAMTEYRAAMVRYASIVILGTGVFLFVERVT